MLQFPKCRPAHGSVSRCELRKVETTEENEDNEGKFGGADRCTLAAIFAIFGGASFPASRTWRAETL
jgi:hypothetical protein